MTRRGWNSTPPSEFRLFFTFFFRGGEKILRDLGYAGFARLTPWSNSWHNRGMRVGFIAKVSFISIFRRFQLKSPSESHSPDSADSPIFFSPRGKSTVPQVRDGCHRGGIAMELRGQLRSQMEFGNEGRYDSYHGLREKGEPEGTAGTPSIGQRKTGPVLREIGNDLHAARRERQVVLEAARGGIGKDPRQLQPRRHLLQPESKIEFRADHGVTRVRGMTAKRNHAAVHHEAEGQRGRFLQALKFPAGRRDRPGVPAAVHPVGQETIAQKLRQHALLVLNNLLAMSHPLAHQRRQLSGGHLLAHPGKALKIGQQNPALHQPDIGHGQPVLLERRGPARCGGHFPGLGFGRLPEHKYRARHLDAVPVSQAHRMRHPLAVDQNAVGASQINHPKFALLFVDHRVAPGGFRRRKHNRIARGAAKGAKPADRDPILAFDFQPRHHLHFKSHSYLYCLWNFRTITNNGSPLAALVSAWLVKSTSLGKPSHGQAQVGNTRPKHAHLLRRGMFQISPDQTQWFHLYRVQKVCPITFVLFACDEGNVHGSTSRLLDLRILAADQNTMGGSWSVKSSDAHGKPATRADCTKFLELHAKFIIANTAKRGVDEIELVESSRDELAMAASLDENLRTKLHSIAPTLSPKLARNLINELGVNRSGLEFEELPDWQTRNAESAG